MKYVVFKTGGKQYKASEGDVLELDKIESGKNGADGGARLLDKGGMIEFDQVLLFVLDGEVKIGKPTLKNVKVKAKVLENFKGEKIRVAKFKAKSRYRRVLGFRPMLSRVKIEKIEASRSR